MFQKVPHCKEIFQFLKKIHLQYNTLIWKILRKFNSLTLSLRMNAIRLQITRMSEMFRFHFPKLKLDAELQTQKLNKFPIHQREKLISPLDYLQQVEKFCKIAQRLMKNQFLKLFFWINWSWEKECFFQNCFGCYTSQPKLQSNFWTFVNGTISNTAY